MHFSTNKDVVEMINYFEANKKIYEAYSNKPRRLLVYALDDNYLPDDLYNDFCSQGRDEKFLEYFYWITRLFWIRRFFEKGHGNDVWQVFRSAFPDDSFAGNVTSSQLQKIVNNQSIKINNPDSFLEQCWLVGGGDEQNGRSSNIWKSLLPLIREIRSGDDIASVIDRFEEDNMLPPFIRKLKNDEDFKLSLKALAGKAEETSERWLAKITPLMANLTNIPNANASWKLYLNGNQRRLDLVLAHIYFPGNEAELEIIQGKNSCRKRLYGKGRLFYPESDLQTMGINSSLSIILKINNEKAAEVAAMEETAVFRYPLNRQSFWLPLIDRGDTASAKQFIIRLPGPPYSVTFGENSYSLDCLDGVKSLFPLELEDIRREPKPLCWNGIELARIGSRPSLEVTGADHGIRYLGEDVDFLIFGNSAPVKLQKWFRDDQPMADLLEVNGDYGDIKRINVEGCRRRILFLPPLNEPLPEGWSLVATEDWSFLENGFCIQELLYENKKFRLAVQLQGMHWWWRKLLEKPEGLDQLKDFNSHSELASYQLNIWNASPEPLSFGGQNLLVGSNEGSWLELNVSEMLNGLLKIDEPGAESDELRMGDTVLARVMRVPKEPLLFLKGGDPYVFFPANSRPESYYTACFFESGIKDNKIEVISCQNLSTDKIHRLDFTHERQNGEAVYLALTDQNIRLCSDLFLFDCHGFQQVISWHKAETSLERRCEISDDDRAKNTVYNILNALFVLKKTKIFQEAIKERESLTHSNSKDFWRNYVSGHCRIETLADTLSLMLQCGFNWCAEPNWLQQAYDMFRGENNLNKICPLLIAQNKIEQGELPPMRDAFLKAINDLIGWKISLPTSDLPKFSSENPLSRIIIVKNRVVDFRIGALGERNVLFSYHGENGLMDARKDFPHRFVIRLEENVKRQCRRFFDGAANAPELTLNPEIEGIYGKCLNDSVEVLGQLKDMFKTVAEYFSETRTAIFQAAVLCRLHAWYGWKKGRDSEGFELSYPENWALNDDSQYNAFCHFVFTVWENEESKPLFMSDMVTAEWLIAWFHISKQ